MKFFSVMSFKWATYAEKMWVGQWEELIEGVTHRCQPHVKKIMSFLAEDTAVHLLLAWRAESRMIEAGPSAVSAMETVFSAREKLRKSAQELLKELDHSGVRGEKGYADQVQGMLERASGVLEDSIKFEQAWIRDHPEETFDPENEAHLRWEQAYDNPQLQDAYDIIEEENRHDTEV